MREERERLCERAHDLQQRAPHRETDCPCTYLYLCCPCVRICRQSHMLRVGLHACAGLAEEAAVVEDLQRRLQEARVSEAALPADIDRLQAELQYEFSRVQSREAGGRSGSI